MTVPAPPSAEVKSNDDCEAVRHEILPAKALDSDKLTMTLTPNAKGRGSISMTSTSLGSSGAVSSKQIPPMQKSTINKEMVTYIDKIACEALERCHLPVEFKRSDPSYDGFSRCNSACTNPLTVSGPYEYAMSIRNRQHHEMIVVAWDSWKRAIQVFEIDDFVVKSRLVPARPQVEGESDIDPFSASQDINEEIFSSSRRVQVSRRSNEDKKKITELKMSVEGLSDIDFVTNYPNLVVLDLNVNRIVNLDSLSSAKPPLEELFLKDNALNCIQGLREISTLRVLNLEANQLTDLSVLERLPNLEQLSANMNRLSAMPVLTSPHLQKLELYHNRICSFSAEHLQHMASLTHLDLGRNKLCAVSGEALSRCQLLSQLVLSQNQIAEVPHPLYLPNLRSLWLSGNKLCNLKKWIRDDVTSCDDSWPVFLPLLERLYLQDNNISNVDANCFASSPFLCEIDLSFNSIRLLQDLSGVLECPLIRILQLQDNPVNKDTLAMQYATSLLSELKELSGQEILQSWPTPELQEENRSSGDKYMQMMVTLQRQGGWTGKVAREPRHMKEHRITFPSTPFWTRRSRTVRNLIHFLSALLIEQNVSRTWGRAVPVQQPGSGDNTLKLTPFVNVLRTHIDLLLKWNTEGIQGHVISIRSPLTPEASCSVPTVIEDSCQSNPGSVSQSSYRRGSKEAQSLQSARFTHAALRIQSLSRGWSTRKTLRRILQSSLYMDDELEAMLGEGNIFAEYEGLLNKVAPELEDDWLQPLARDAPRGYAHEGDAEYDMVISSAGSEGSFVYGDHKRRRHLNAQPSMDQDVDSTVMGLKPTTPPEPSGRSSPRPGQVAGGPKRGDWASVSTETGRDTELHNAGVYINRLHGPTQSPHVSGDMSGNLLNLQSSTAAESSRPASRSSNMSSTSSRFGLGKYDMEEDADMLLHTARSRTSNLSDQAAEWGISDPTVVQAMMKRNKRLK